MVEQFRAQPFCFATSDLSSNPLPTFIVLSYGWGPWDRRDLAQGQYSCSPPPRQRVISPVALPKSRDYSAGHRYFHFSLFGGPQMRFVQPAVGRRRGGSEWHTRPPPTAKSSCEFELLEGYWSEARPCSCAHHPSQPSRHGGHSSGRHRSRIRGSSVEGSREGGGCS